MEHEAVGATVISVPSRWTRASAMKPSVVVVGNFLLDEACTVRLLFEGRGTGLEDADGALDHGLGVGRSNWEWAQPWARALLQEPGLDALRVVEGAAWYDAVRGADGDGPRFQAPFER